MAIPITSFSAHGSESRARLVAYWITTLAPMSFVIGGTLFLTHGPQQMAQLNALGLPAYFATILGFWKLAGAVVIAAPRLPLVKEWAYAEFAFLLSGAFASHLLHGDGPDKFFPPLFFLALTGASWALRPASRRLAYVAADRESV